MKRTISIILIIAGVGLAVFGFTKLNDNQADVKIGDLELSAQNQSETNKAYYLIGGGAVALMVGLFMARGKR